MQPANAYMVKYKEDWYRLYHIHYQQYPDDCIENIYWLEKAAQADFANPLYATAKIRTEKEWEKYLVEMREHFLNACKEYENSSPEARKEFDELYKDFSAAEYFKNPELYNTKERKEKIKEYYKKVKEYDNYKQEELKKGMDMFQKRFWDLWD